MKYKLNNPFMMMAIKEAKKGISKGHGGPFGAIIVKDNIVISKGHNEVIKNNDPTCHGEIMAIHKACKKLNNFDLSGCVIYTTGEPCPMCLAAILWANIDKVYYGCNIKDTEAIGFRDSKFFAFANDKQAKSEFLHELNRNECLKLYEDYRKIEGKVNY